MKFSVVIINYNRQNLLRKCLNRVRASSLKPEKIIVVDDASSDNSASMVKKEFPEAVLIQNKTNFGPTKSRNIGAKQAIGDYIIFLDNDLMARKDTFEKLTDFMRKNPSAGICGARMKPDGQEKMWWNMGYDPNNFRESIGYLFGFLLKIFPASKFLKKASMIFILNYWDYNKIFLVDWVVEGCFIVKKNAFDQVGGFDEKFFMFFEGPDLCRRIRKLGYQIYFNPEIETDLFDGHSHSNQKRLAWSIQSKHYFYQKHYFYLKSNPLFFWLGNLISGALYKISNK